MAKYIEIINYRGTANIYYSAHGNNLRLSTGIKISVDDFTKQGKLKSSFINKNPMLVSKIKYIDDFITDYIILKHIEPSVSLVKSKIKENKQEALGKNLPVIKYFETFYDYKKQEFTFDKDRSITSLKDYKSFWNSLIDYEKYTSKTLYLDDIDKNELDNYRTFMYQKRIDTNEIKYITIGNLNPNTFRKRIVVFKTFHYWLVENDIISEVPKSLLNYRIKKVETHKEFLTSEEILKLFEISFKNPLHNKIKDAFVFACHTGMRFSDLTSINKEHFKIKNGCVFVRKRAEKVNEYFMVPLSDIANGIAVKYNYSFNFVTNQTFNSNLKDIMKLSKLFNTETDKKDENGKKIMRFQLFHTHSARHSFITNLVNERIALNEIMSMTGHKKLETLNIYINKQEPESNETMNIVFGYKNKKK